VRTSCPKCGKEIYHSGIDVLADVWIYSFDCECTFQFELLFPYDIKCKIDWSRTELRNGKIEIVEVF